MNDLKGKLLRSATPGSLLSTCVHDCVLAYLQQTAGAAQLVPGADCLTKAQQQELVAFFREWLQRLRPTSNRASPDDTGWNTSEQPRPYRHLSLAVWYWSVLLWLSLLKHQQEWAEPWAAEAVDRSLHQLDTAARTFVQDATWDRQGLVASIVSLLADRLCRQSLPVSLVLPLHVLLQRVLKREGPEGDLAAAQAACTKLQSLPATAIYIVKLLESLDDFCAFAGGSLLLDLLSVDQQGPGSAGATPEQLQLVSRLLKPRLRCLDLVHCLGGRGGSNRECYIANTGSYLVLSCYASLAVHPACRPTQAMVDLVCDTIQRAPIQTDKEVPLGHHELAPPERAMTCIAQLWRHSLSTLWKAQAMLSLHNYLQASSGISAHEQGAVDMLRQMWAHAEAADVVMAVKPLSKLWLYVARCWANHPTLREPMAYTLSTKLVRHAGFSTCLAAQPLDVWRDFGNMLHVAMTEGTSMAAHVHLLLFLLRVLHFHGDSHDLICSRLDEREPLIPATGRTMQRLLEVEPACSERQGWADDLMDACTKVLSNSDYSCADMQPAVLHLGKELVARQSLPNDLKSPAAKCAQTRGSFVVAALSAHPSYAGRLLTSRSLQNCSWLGDDKIYNLLDKAGLTDVASRAFVFMESHIFVTMALCTAASARGLNPLSQLEGGDEYTGVLLTPFTRLLHGLDPLQQSDARQSKARDHCRKAAICLRFFGMLAEAERWTGLLDAAQQVKVVDACIVLLAKLPLWLISYQDCKLPERHRRVLHDAIQLGGPTLIAITNWLKYSPDLAVTSISQRGFRDFRDLPTLLQGSIGILKTAGMGPPESVLRTLKEVAESIIAQGTAEAEAAAAQLIGEEEAHRAAAATKAAKSAEKKRRQQAKRQAARMAASPQSTASPADDLAQHDQQAADAGPGTAGRTCREPDEHACSSDEPATGASSGERLEVGGAGGSASHAAPSSTTSPQARTDARFSDQLDNEQAARSSAPIREVTDREAPEAGLGSPADSAEVATGPSRMGLASGTPSHPRSLQPLPPLVPQPAVAMVAPAMQLGSPVMRSLIDIEDICCPITQEVMQDPVVAEDSHTYERAAITAWLAKSNISPMTGMPFPCKAGASLIPNIALRQLIQWRSGTQAARTSTLAGA